MNSITVEQLYQLSNSENVSNSTKATLSTLLDAINDWPNEIHELDQYLSEVISFIGGEITRLNVSNSLSNIDYSINSWQAESISQLNELFKIFPDEISQIAILKHINNG